MEPANAKLFTPVRLGPLTLRNRTVRSAAFEGMCPDGRPSDSLVRYHRSVAEGGIGMTTVAYAAVTPGGRTFAHQMWMREEIVPDLRRLADAVHDAGAAVSIQLGDAGYMSDRWVTRERPLAPSRVFNLFGLAMPRAMEEADIARFVESFARAVRLVREAGFDAVEIQAGHGYLISQFLSPYTNRRDDGWGGPLEGRARLLLEVLTAARREAGEHMAVVVKMNVDDGITRGMPLEEAVRVAQMLEAGGAHGLILSGGFVSKCPMYLMRGEIPLWEMVKTQRRWTHKIGLALFGRLLVASYPFTEAYFLDQALRIREAVRLPLALVGGLRSLAKMEEVLGRGFDLIAMARPLIIEPDFVRKLERGETTVSKCEPCNRCMASMYFGEFTCPLKEELSSDG